MNVYYGSQFGLAHTPAIVLHGNQTAAYLGTACPIVGDINGDGYDDLVVGAEGYTEGEANEGHAYVYLGSPTGIHSVPDQTLQINVADARFGFAIYRIGDVNGDGYADVAIDAPGISDPEASEGELLVYYGSPSGLEVPAAWTLEGDQAGDGLGQSGISGADVNADGIADLVVGEPNSNFGASNGGRMRVFLGSTGGLDIASYFTEWSTIADYNFGYATGGEGDFDGDGFPDLYYTEPGLALVGSFEGGAYVRLGNSIWPGTRNPDRPLGTWRADDSAPVQPGLRSDSQTAFRLKGRARSSVGRTRLRLESEVKPVNAPFAFTGHAKSSWQSTGPVAAGAGSSAPMDVALTGLASATKYHWRARYQTKSLFFPVTPWFSTEQRNASERHISTAGAPGAVDVPPVPVLSATEVALAPPAPNPSVGSGTSLAFSLPTPGAARLALYDLRGALVRTLFDAKAVAGTTRVTWDGLDAQGRRAPAGAYFARLTALGKERVEKLVRLD